VTAPILPELVTMSALAKRSGVSRTTLWRRLLRLHGRTSDKSWLVREGRNWSVNLERLRATEPHFAPAPNVTDILDDHEERLVVLERLALKSK
jgi:hypothetical protein